MPAPTAACRAPKRADRTRRWPRVAIGPRRTSTGSPGLDDDNFECDGTPEATCAESDDGLRGCYPTCESAEDCALAFPIGPVASFRCDAGLCIHLGCQADTECDAPLDSCVVL